ncbi:MAG: rolling circle replication-associated protein [Lachnospiraceae bacterium]
MSDSLRDTKEKNIFKNVSSIISPCGGKNLFLLESTGQQYGYKMRVRVNPSTGEIIDCMGADRTIFGSQDTIEKSEYEKRRKEFLEMNYELSLDENMTAGLYERMLKSEDDARKEYRKHAVNRARRKVFDLASCNEWEYFVTLTLDPEKIDRYDYKAAVGRLNRWLDNRVRQKGLKYLGVPEYHKDKAIHFHFLTKGGDFKLKNSGLKSKGRIVYNVLDWPIGWSTAVVCDKNRNRLAGYISKYITKQTKENDPKRHSGTIGGRYYFHGGELVKPESFYFNVDKENFESIIAMKQDDGIKKHYIESADVSVYYIDPELIQLQIVDMVTGETSSFDKS